MKISKNLRFKASTYMYILSVAIISISFVFVVLSSSTVRRASPESYTFEHTTDTNATELISKKFTSKCIVHFYGQYRYEFKWFSEVVLSRIEPQCCCFIKYHDIKAFSSDVQHGIVSGDVNDKVVLCMDEVPAIDLAPLLRSNKYDGLFKKIVLFVLGDEQDKAEDWFYKKFKVVYRNYYGTRGSLDIYRNLTMDLSKLKLNNSSGVSVWWYPLGYSNSLIHEKGLRLPIKSRSLLFFWSGSTAGKQERLDFIKSLNENPRIKSDGFLHKYELFQGTMKEHLPIQDYSRMMYDSKYSPCPAGVSPEQFRISETLETGAIPIIVKNHTALAYLGLLGFQLINVDSFKDITFMLNTKDEELQRMQDVNFELWDLVKMRLAKHVALSVCN